MGPASRPRPPCPTRDHPVPLNFHALMSTRWSCREFHSYPMPDDLLTRIFTTAQRTASWCNTQPWQVHLLGSDAVTWLGKELTARVSEGAPMEPDLAPPTSYEGVYRDRQRESGLALYNSLGIERSNRTRRDEQMLRNYTFFGAPHVAIITTERTQGTYGAVDVGGYVANLMNAALEVGIASIAQGAIGLFSTVVRDLLDIPEDRLVVCSVALGHAEADHPVNQFRTSRADIDDLVTRVERPRACSGPTARVASSRSS